MLRAFGFLLKVSIVAGILGFMSHCFIFIYNFMVQSDYFNAQKISVSGVGRLSDHQVIAHSQLSPGKNILSMNLCVAKRILQRHPWIADAEIDRNFPSGISIKIKEHRPLAVLDVGRNFIINDEGEIFSEIEIPLSETPDFPLIKGLDLSDIDPNGKVKGTPFREVMKILTTGQNGDNFLSRHRVESIHIDRHTGITLKVSGRIRIIKLGYGNYPEKFKKIQKILSFLEKRPDLSEYVEIDLNNIHRIVLKLSLI